LGSAQAKFMFNQLSITKKVSGNKNKSTIPLNNTPELFKSIKFFQFFRRYLT